MNTQLNTIMYWLSLIGLIYYTFVGIHESAWICFATMVASWAMHTGNMLVKMMYVILQWLSGGRINPKN